MRALIVSADGFEDRELEVPATGLRAAGIQVEVATPRGVTIHGKHGAAVEADLTIEAVDPANYDLLLLPGGRAPALLRKDPKVLAIARRFFAEEKSVAAICHGPQILVSAELLRGKKATSYGSVAPELIAAGADYSDQAVVVDGNLITARKPADLPQFVAAILKKLGSPASSL